MNDPHHVLGLEAGAGEDAVRRRYLELVRQHPPDRDPERFAEIRGAYDALRDPVRRLERRLFRLAEDDSLLSLQDEVRARIRFARIPTDRLLDLAESS
jgi:curved DNA-binding protein CbpA